MPKKGNATKKIALNLMAKKVLPYTGQEFINVNLRRFEKVL
jgi:hypothetical protein